MKYPYKHQCHCYSYIINQTFCSKKILNGNGLLLLLLLFFFFYNTSIIIFFINLFVFLLTNRFLYLHDCTLFTLEYLRYLQNNIFTTVLTNMILKLLTKQFLHYLQCSDYTRTDKVTAPIFVILYSYYH